MPLIWAFCPANPINTLVCTNFILARIFHEHFAHFKVTSVNHMIKLRIIPYFKFAKCSPKASRCD
ncbi:MAG: hypothetical protein U9P36_05060, partial [Thermodesulfobacteriota bacterium]|nr:hypothetical protein [Thermodesulfobacteriota bacterium]